MKNIQNNPYDNAYEDEIDRMRARSQRRKERGRAPGYGEEDFAKSRTRSREPQNATRGSGRGRQEDTLYNRRNSPQNPSHGKRKRKKKRVFLPLLIVLLFLGLAGSYLLRGMRSTGFWTIAVFGVDSRDGNLGKGALSDVEMLCSINRETGEIRLASVFRDSYLRIDQEGRYDKINEAYFLGGHEQAVAALKDNLDLEIDDYATFNWKAVIDAINVLGGVDLEITDKEFAYINSFITETVESTGVGSYQLEHSGMNHLDGVQAVAYARLRLMDTDFNRTERQRKVLGLAMEKAKAADATTLKDLVAVVFPQVSTSVGMDDLLGMAKNAKKYYIGQTSGFPFSHVEMKIGKKSCVIPATLESNVAQLHGFLYDDTEYQVSQTVREISSHIASESGVGEPGRDTESGKNVGAQGSSGGNGSPAQTAPQQSAQQPPQQPAQPDPAESESAGDGDASQESASDPDSLATENTEDGAEETDREIGEYGEGITSPGENSPAVTGPGFSPEGGSSSGGSQAPGDSSGAGQPSSAGPFGNGTQPSGGSSTDQRPAGSLEGPGQHTESPAQPGPGTGNSGNGGSGSTGGPGAVGPGSGGSPGSAPEGGQQGSSGNGAVAGPGM